MYKYLESTMYGENPKLLIFKEKHGTWYFATHDATEFSMALLYVINQRLEEGWYLDELYGDDLPKEGENPNQTDMFKKTTKPKTDKKTVQDIVDLARSDAEDAVIEAGALAYVFLMARGDENYEYEDFEIEFLDTPKFSLTPS